jgi:hypothetical protein
MPVRYAGVILFLRLPSILFFTETVVSPCKIDLQLEIKVDQLEYLISGIVINLL